MSQLIEILVGGVLVLLVFFDVLATTLVVPKGPGPLTRRFAGLLWRSLLLLHRRDSHSRWPNFGGPVVLVATVFAWLEVLWAGLDAGLRR